MKLSAQPIYRVGEIEIDSARGCLRRRGQEQALQQKSFQVLLYLIAERQRLVTKEELVEQVWEGTAVTDDALVQRIVDVRKALGDDPRQPRFIKTVPKVGYRFIGPVEEVWGAIPAPGAEITRGPVTVEEVTALEVGLEETVDEDPGLSSRRRVALVSALAVVLMAALAIYLGRWFGPAGRPVTDVALASVPGKKPVAVMYFENQSGDRELDWLREGLADMLITNLSRSRRLTLLSRQQLAALLDHIGYQTATKIGLKEGQEIGRRAQAEVLILGRFARLGEQVRIDVTLHDPRSGQLQAAESLVAERPELILSQIDLLSLKLATHLGAAPTQEDTHGMLASAMTSNLEAYRYYSLAMEKTQALHNAEAIALLEKAIALDPQFALAQARIGYVYALSWAFPEKARPHLEKVFRLADRLTEKDRLSITAWYAVANSDYSGAIRAFRELIAHYPLEVEAYWRLGRLLRGEVQHEEAISVFKQGLVIDPEARFLYNELGNTYAALGQHAEALQAHQRHVQLAPEEPNAYDSLGLTYQWAGRYEEALAAYQRGLALDPEFEILIVHLGNLYFWQGRYREALAQYHRYIHVAPSESEQARGYGQLAWVHWKRRELDRAEAAARTEMRLDERSVATTFLLALDRGDLQTAEKLKEELFVKNPYHSRGARLTTRFLFYFRGYLALKRGRAEAAIEDFKEALRQESLHWNIDPLEDCLANAYLELGRHNEAIAEYERILRVNPNYPLAQYHLGQAYERKDERERARAAYERFLQIWQEADQDIPEVIDAKRRLRGWSGS